MGDRITIGSLALPIGGSGVAGDERAPFEELRRRPVARATDAPEGIGRRLAGAGAGGEKRQRVKYHHVIVNDDVERTLAGGWRRIELEEACG